MNCCQESVTVSSTWWYAW